MREVVINKCFGGFSLSHKAVMAYAERKGIKLYPEPHEIGVRIYGAPTDLATFKGVIGYYKVPPERYHAEYERTVEAGEDFKRLNSLDWYFSERDIARDDPDLVAVVRDLGTESYGRHASLEIVEIPDDVEWTIDEYDGWEHVAEAHRTWA